MIKSKITSKTLHEKTLNIICTEVIDEPGSQFQMVGGKLQRMFCLENFAIELTRGKLLHNAREHQTKSSKCDKKANDHSYVQEAREGGALSMTTNVAAHAPIIGLQDCHEGLQKPEMNVMIYVWYGGKELGYFLH